MIPLLHLLLSLPFPPEAAVRTQPSPPKGFGAFAVRPIPTGAFVGFYEGDVLTLDEQEERYPYDGPFPMYCLRLSSELCIDAAPSEHWSRFVNHDERANLRVVTDAGRAWFEAYRDIVPGEELCFDYGPVFFHVRGIEPAPGTESREVAEYDGGEESEGAEEEERIWREAGLPEVPSTREDVRQVLSASCPPSLPSTSTWERMRKCALLRSLDYYGAVEWVDDDTFVLKIGGGPPENILRSAVGPEELGERLEELLASIPMRNE